ncbi:MAG TPA: hypothetical protein VMW25_05920 [Clostridia bacterium]|nr:hypothetical protein [Clostridia bacterium]
MRGQLRKEKLLWQIIKANLLLIGIGLLALLAKKNSLPPIVPFFYSRPWGEEQLVPSNYLFFIPGFSLAVFLFNLQLARLLLKKGEKFLVLLSSGFALLFSALGTISLIKIIFLVT